MTLDPDPLYVEEDPTMNTGKCRHPRDKRANSLTGGWTCLLCDHYVTPERSRLGRLSRSRGNAKERAAAKRNGTVRSGQFGGKDDYRRGMFAFQNKSLITTRFPGWITRELDALRLAQPTREPILHIEEAPGPGNRPRRIYVMDETTWLNLHGPQVEESVA